MFGFGVVDEATNPLLLPVAQDSLPRPPQQDGPGGHVGRNQEQRDAAPAMAANDGEDIAGSALRSYQPTILCAAHEQPEFLNAARHSDVKSINKQERHQNASAGLHEQII